MLTRRRFLIGSAAIAWWPAACARRLAQPGATTVNDVHAQLSPTEVHRVVRVDSLDAVRTAIRTARGEGRPISIAGGRHAMGGQQFGAGTVLLDTTSLKRVLRFDPERGQIEVEAGMQWPELIDSLLAAQRGRPGAWGIIQNQTGA